ncbi:TIGR03619 family F420-dependent LLM class oxidoreductase [Amycolatopsis sp., V23-08]|uniref:TIGR03619 family F420-dependent LLM class oxidoreductase n=1 Tax=Amycolatopsis heterodermiae TaxID=3110235 RepID=A0ABU5R6Y7_9PSEU|nr:TIGR03619 family F420-dependent LLM class oxidoreductase [Amycolatopsis sp., V23-08]MEA5361993.1 TIGR03619 family F420-dependent LLM class oxidoreductase [Amycolatopsis sp., V23-08]
MTSNPVSGTRLGLALPQYGALADPAAVARFAVAAEGLGFASLWVGDRILTPLEPSDLYPGGGTPEHPYPEEFTTFADPFTTLATAAAVTSTVRLGMSALTGPVYSPVLLARALTSLDLASAGRLDVGLGLGWLREEYFATGVPWEDRGRRLDEVLDALEAIWTGDPVSHEGPQWRIAPSTVGLRPAQDPRPPVLLAGFAPPALARIGRRADGWLAGWMPRPYLKSLWTVALETAEKAGRDPGTLRRVLRINPRAGTGVESVADVLPCLDVAREEGIAEVLVDLHYVAKDVDHALELAGELAS